MASFAGEVAPARTFGLFEQLEGLREQVRGRVGVGVGAGLA